MNALRSSKSLGVASILCCCLITPERPRLYGSSDAGPLALPGHAPADPPAPQVTMKLRVPAHAAPGRELEYRVFLENSAAGDAHHVIVKCPLPPGVKFVRASPAPHQKEPELQWHLGTMHGGGKCEVSLIVLPEGKDDVSMCFRVQYEHGQCVTTRLSELPPAEPLPPPDQDGKRPPQIRPVPPIVAAEALAKLTLKMDGPKERYANMPAKYFITVVNEGKAPATNLLVRAMLPEKTEFVAASDDGVHVAGQVAWLLRELGPNQKWTVDLTYRSKEPGLRCVKASALADKNVSAEEKELCTNFVGVSALYLEMIDRDDPIPVGGDTSFPITVVNTGSAPVTNLRVRALVPSQMVLTKTLPAEHQLGERTPQGQWIVFVPAASLEGGARADFEVFVKGVQAGDARFRIEMSADQLERGPVTELESTHIYDDEATVPARLLSRKRR